MCDRLQFQTSFETRKYQQARVEDYEADWIFGKIYNSNDKETFVEHAMNLEGATLTNVTRNLESWESVLKEFTKTIGWGK